jgi:hypothetical protein
MRIIRAGHEICEFYAQINAMELILKTNNETSIARIVALAKS